MDLFRLIFPAQNRTFRGKRWLRIILRCFHIYGISIVVGGTFFAVPMPQLVQFYLITGLSGLALILVDIYTNGIWLIQNRGWIILPESVALRLRKLVHSYFYIVVRIFAGSRQFFVRIIFVFCRITAKSR